MRQKRSFGLMARICNLRFLAIVCFIVVGFSLSFGVLTDASAAEQKKVTFKLHTAYPPNNVMNQTLCQYWAKELEKRSDGKIKVNIFYSGALGRQGTEVEMLKKGICEVALVPVSYNLPSLPLMDIAYLPGLYTYPGEGVGMYKALGDKGFFDEALNGVHLLFYQANDAARLFTVKKKINKMEDLKGLKIWFNGGIVPKSSIEELGGTPVSVPTGDVYMALSTGILDGIITAPSFLLDIKLTEVVKYAPKTIPLIGGANLAMMSDRAWGKLTPESQQIVLQLNQDAQAFFLELALKSFSNADEKLEKAGLEVYSLEEGENDRWLASQKATWDLWVSDYEKKGITKAKEELDYILENQGSN